MASDRLPAIGPARVTRPQVPGIDVSAAQGVFDWAPWRGRIGFAFMRATTWTAPANFVRDPQLDRNARECWDRWGGTLVRGYYHETRAATSRPDVQARHFIAALGDNLVAGDLLAVVMGDNGGNGALSPLSISVWHAAFFSELFRLIENGHRALPYCNPSWSREGNCEGLGHRPLWLADYGVGTVPPAPEPWREWTFLQYADAPAPDRDVFNGDHGHLADFANMPAYRR